MLHLFIPLPPPCSTKSLDTTDLFTVSRGLPFLECRIVRVKVLVAQSCLTLCHSMDYSHIMGIMSYVCSLFQIGFFHLMVCIYVSFMSFHGLVTHLFLALNNIHCVDVPVYLLKDILVVSKFWQL